MWRPAKWHVVVSPSRAALTALMGRQNAAFFGVGSSPRRFCSTTLLEQMVINASRWDDSNYYHRLGFCEEVRDISRIKEHYRILAKHYHPDNPNAPPNATVAFQNIREAYEHVSSNAKETPNGTQGPVSGFRFSDHARRKEQMRFLGDGVGLFVVMTFVFIYIVSKHNKERLKARYLWDLLFIFFLIQLFPRLLAAAILYACHTNYLVRLTEAEGQAATSLVVERQEGGRLCISLHGITEEVQKDTVVQVTMVSAVTPAERAEGDDVPTASTSTTLTFDPGVTTLSVPAPPGGPAECRVKAVDMTRGFVLTDRTLRL